MTSSIQKLIQQKETLEVLSSKTNGSIHEYIEGKLSILNQVLEKLEKLLESYKEVFQEINTKEKIEKDEKEYFVLVGEQRILNSVIGELENLI